MVRWRVHHLLFGPWRILCHGPWPSMSGIKAHSKTIPNTAKQLFHFGCEQWYRVDESEVNVYILLWCYYNFHYVSRGGLVQFYRLDLMNLIRMAQAKSVSFVSFECINWLAFTGKRLLQNAARSDEWYRCEVYFRVGMDFRMKIFCCLVSWFLTVKNKMLVFMTWHCWWSKAR